MYLKEMGKTPVRIAGRARLEPATGGSCHSSLTVRANARSHAALEDNQKTLFLHLITNNLYFVALSTLTLETCSLVLHK